MGLGFDPHLHMDSMMQSPSHDPQQRLEPVDLGALSLEPAAAGPSSSRHLFAFESGSTWGATGTSGSNDWGVPISSNGFSAEGNDTPLTSAFLNLGSTTTSSSNTWAGLSGLGGTLNGDQPTGD